MLDELARYGFKKGDYTKIIAETCHGSRPYFADYTLRTVQLLQRSGGGK